MSESANTSQTNPASTWVPLGPRERRVVGVLVEKAKTTAEYYPMSLAAIVTACNQKSNRDPVTNYDQDDVEDTLTSLRKKGAVILIDGSGRAVRWKHTLYDWLKVTKLELAVLAELLLRGPQTEGELRARASRMEPLADLPALQTVLEALEPRRLIHYLTPREQKRGVIVTHGLYPVDELEKVRQSFVGRVCSDEPPQGRISDSATSITAERSVAPAWVKEIDDLRSELKDLRQTVKSLADEVHELRSALGG